MKKVKIITIVLAIILITLAAFGGVYIKTQNRMENKVIDYKWERELYGERVIELKIATSEDSKPSEEEKTVENYETVKNTIEERLKFLGAGDYTISLNKEDGTIFVQLPEDENIETYIYFLTASGEVQIKEKDTSTELLNDSMIKKALYTYTADAEGAYQVYAQLHLTKDGQAKIEEIKNNYAIFASEVEEIEAAQEEEKKKEENKEETTTEETAETTTEATTETEETKQEETRKIAKLTIAGTEYDIDKIEKDVVTIKIGEKSTNNTSINSNINEAVQIVLLVNSGKYPITYEIGENQFVHTDITQQQILYIGVVIAVVLLITFIIYIIMYKTNGLLVSISFIGFISILSLLIRYTNVSISIEGIGAIIFVFILNLIVNNIILKNVKEKNNVSEVIVETYKDVFLKLVPVIIATLVFSFAGVTNLISFGMIMFWGLSLIAVYNVVVTKTLLKLKENK